MDAVLLVAHYRRVNPDLSAIMQVSNAPRLRLIGMLQNWAHTQHAQLSVNPGQTRPLHPVASSCSLPKESTLRILSSRSSSYTKEEGVPSVVAEPAAIGPFVTGGGGGTVRRIKRLKEGRLSAHAVPFVGNPKMARAWLFSRCLEETWIFLGLSSSILGV